MAPDRTVAAGQEADVAHRVASIEERLANIQIAVARLATIAAELALCVHGLQERQGHPPAPTEEAGDRLLYLYRHRS